jgi:surfactin synthase thioesterase subunit
MKHIRLFCFPYAGGSASAYSGWKRYLHSAVDLYPVELAGRGRRIREPLHKSFNELLLDAFHAIEDKLYDLPYAFFGHSMGGLVAYELAQRVRLMHAPGPLRLFISGRGVPSLKREPLFHLLPDDKLKEDLIELGGITREFCDNEELLKLFMPILKNDFKIAETWEYVRNPAPLNYPISVLAGTGDAYVSGGIEAWKRYTRNDCNYYYFEGGHFFIHEQTQAVVDIVNEALLRAVPAL